MMRLATQILEWAVIVVLTVALFVFLAGVAAEWWSLIR